MARKRERQDKKKEKQSGDHDEPKAAEVAQSVKNWRGKRNSTGAKMAKFKGAKSLKTLYKNKPKPLCGEV